MPASPAATLEAGLAELGLALSDGARGKLIDYLALLAKWNRTYNLTSIRDTQRMVTHHLLDALAALPGLPERAIRVLDVGSGGGVPGIPWAIARPSWRVTLAESSRKKAAFLLQATIELQLTNVRVRDERVERLGGDERFDLIASRAFADLATFAAVSAPRLAPGGTLVALKGERPDAEIAALPAEYEVRRVIPLAVPGLAAERHLVLLQPRSPA